MPFIFFQRSCLWYQFCWLGREQFYYFSDPSTRRSNSVLVLAIIHFIYISPDKFSCSPRPDSFS